MSRIGAVAWSEFKRTVLTKVFLLALVGVPVFMVGIMVVVVLLANTQEQPPLVGTVALVEASGELVTAARDEFSPDRVARDRQRQLEEIKEASERLLSDPGAMGAAGAPAFNVGRGTGEVRIDLEAHEAAGGEALAALKERVLNGGILALAVVPSGVFATPADGGRLDGEATFDLFVREGLDSDHLRFIENRLGRAIVRVRAARAGLDADKASALLERPEARTSRVLAGGREAAEGEGVRDLRDVVPFIFLMLLWAATLTSGQHLMMSTIEEKSNRVMEVLLSAVSPFQLMTGKIIGQGGSGLLIVLIYSSLGVAALAVFGALHVIDPLVFAFLGAYFFMAYFMIASIMAAVGSAVTDIREANTLVTPVMFVLMIPLMLCFPISESPNGPLAAVFSFVPPAIPFVMVLRLAADEPVSFWQVPATLIWGYACVLAMMWAAAKIFRVGVLMYGKPPSPVQMVKWLKYS